jgi:Raf kinase inhibitor-like YbhB/YbcL family protein
MKKEILIYLISLLIILTVSCKPQPPVNADLRKPAVETTIIGEERESVPGAEEVSEMGMKVTSPVFENMQGIPEVYTCKGEDISPPLAWDGIPDSTTSLVLIMDDPDAPVGTWDHWIVFNLPPDLIGLEEDARSLPEGSLTGQNSWRRNDYGGPCPPGGARHRYFFKLYALDVLLDLPVGAKKSQIETAMQGHILAQAELIGIYKP